MRRATRFARAVRAPRLPAPKLNVGEPKSGVSVPMKRPNLRSLSVVLFIIVGAVSAALGCPFFRNPENYATAGGMFAYMRYVVDVHRKH